MRCRDGIEIDWLDMLEEPTLMKDSAEKYTLSTADPSINHKLPTLSHNGTEVPPGCTQ